MQQEFPKLPKVSLDQTAYRQTINVDSGLLDQRLASMEDFCEAGNRTHDCQHGSRESQQSIQSIVPSVHGAFGPIEALSDTQIMFAGFHEKLDSNYVVPALHSVRR